MTARAGHAGCRDRPVGHAHPSGPGAASPRSSGTSRSRTAPAWSSCRARRSRFAAAATFSAAVELAPRARLIWGDIWLPGRYERGDLSERFQFERIVQDFEVRREGRLVYRDRFRWDGPWTTEDAEWYFGGTLASASLFIAGPGPRGFARYRSRSPSLESSASLPAKAACDGLATRDCHCRPRVDGARLAAHWTDRARCASLASGLEWSGT